MNLGSKETDGQHCKRQRGDKQQSQTPVQPEQKAVNPDKGDHHPDDVGGYIRKKQLQIIHVIGGHSQQIPGLAILKKTGIKALHVGVDDQAQIMTHLLGHRTQAVVADTLAQGQSQEDPQHGQAEPEKDARLCSGALLAGDRVHYPADKHQGQ